MKKILFVGEHPLGPTGNGKMLRAILSQLDTKEYVASCFVFDQSIGPNDLFAYLPMNVISSTSVDMELTMRQLFATVEKGDIDYLVFVGVDLWYYCRMYEELRQFAKEQDFKFVHIFPYDIPTLRSDWVKWINMIDYPYVYSRYGYDMLKDEVPNLKYYRPAFQMPEIWKPVDEEGKREVRKQLFPTVADDEFLFGFIGPNQVRKDPARLIRAFSIVKDLHPNAKLYMHCNAAGSYNLIQTAEDCGLESGDFIMKKEGSLYVAADMPKLYQSFDCFMNCSLQEGLSWTTLEAMLCGIPVIASDSTAHKELLDGAGTLVPCNDLTYIPLYGKRGQTQMEAFACNPEEIANAMNVMMVDKLVRDRCTLFGRDFATAWLEDVSSINDLLEEVGESEKIVVQEQVPAILFAQHSAAGDILMTTRCLKGLKDRHPGFSLHYMTQKKYANVLEGNPLIDKVIEWDDSQLQKYQFPYNPHGEVILPGHWGRNSNSILADFYWKVLNLDEPDDFYIQKDKPEYIETFEDTDDLGFWERDKVPARLERIFTSPFCVVHTTGGDPQFRTYKYMADVCKGLKDLGFPTVQLGGPDDFPAGADYDFRGQKFTEDAWVMSKARFAVTIDSFHAHLAGALGVSQVVLFGSGNAAVCQPKQVGGNLICLSPDYVRDCQGLGPCSASVRDCAIPCTGSHSPDDILSAIEELIRMEEK